MTKTPLVLALAATVAIGALPSLAAAQSYDQQQSYQQQQDAYQQRLHDYNDQKAAYDAQQQRRYGNRYDSARNTAPCNERSSNNAAASGIFGALAGAAIGSSLAGRGSHTEGAVLGAVAGGAIGASVGSNSARCDNDGRYYSYNQTVQYREPSDYSGRNSGRYNYDRYRREGCRMVAVPSEWNDGQTRYARACPDSHGRYRLTE